MSNSDIREFGAIGDGQTVNTAVIQNAVDACCAGGGGQVLVSGGTYVTGTVLLRDGVTLHLDESATLLGSPNPADYRSIDTFVDAVGRERGVCLIGAQGASRVGITGTGKIDGQGGLFREKGDCRPFLVRLVDTTDIVLEGVELRQSAAWTCHFYQCARARVKGVRIFSHAYCNNDGIDLDSSSEVVISECDIDSGDDAICFKSTSPKACHHISVYDCRLKSDWGAIKFGTESMGDMHHIEIARCRIHDTLGGGIKILSVDGANITDIQIRELEMDQVDMPVFIRLGERRKTYRGAPQQDAGSIDRIVIRNVRARAMPPARSRVSPPAGIFITGTPDHPVGNITMEQIALSLPGGGSADDAARVVEERERDYPEYQYFGVLPSYGLFARHIRDLRLDRIQVVPAAPDQRPAFLIDGKQVEVQNV